MLPRLEEFQAAGLTWTSNLMKLRKLWQSSGSEATLHKSRILCKAAVQTRRDSRVREVERERGRVPVTPMAYRAGVLSFMM